jgi:predicted amidohydrolase YtcJ
MAIITKYLFLPFFILSCKSSQQKGDTFYFGGNITMEDDFPQVDALVVKGGKILFVSSRKEAAPM